MCKYSQVLVAGVLSHVQVKLLCGHAQYCDNNICFLLFRVTSLLTPCKHIPLHAQITVSMHFVSFVFQILFLS